MLSSYAKMKNFGQSVSGNVSIFAICLLSEVQGQWYTRPLVSTMDKGQPSSSQLVINDCGNTQPLPLVSNIDECQPSTSQLVADSCGDVELDVNEVYCYCKGPDKEKMIGCDNKTVKSNGFI